MDGWKTEHYEYDINTLIKVISKTKERAVGSVPPFKEVVPYTLYLWRPHTKYGIINIRMMAFCILKKGVHK